MKIKEICVDERPREKMLAKGADAMSNAELLAILIGSGTQKENVLEVANRLLAEGKGKLSMIADMDARRMKEIGGIGSVRYAAIAAAFELGKRCCLEDPGIEKVPLTDAEIVYRMMPPPQRVGSRGILGNSSEQGQLHHPQGDDKPWRNILNCG